MQDLSLSPHKKTKWFFLTFASFLFIPCLFLSSLNFINKYFYFLYACFAILFFFLIGMRTFYVNGMVFVLFGISLCYLIFSPDSSYAITGFLKLFVFPLSYICGLNCLRQFEYSKKDKVDEDELWEKRKRGFLLLCMVIAAGLLVHVLLNLYANPEAAGRNIVDFWTKDATSATCNAAMFCFGIGLIPALLLHKSGVWGKLFAAVNIVAFVAFALVLAGRTFFLLFAIVFVSVLFFSSFRERKTKAIWRALLIIVLVTGALTLLYMQNIFGIRELFESSNLYERFFGKYSNIDLTDDTRIRSKQTYFDNMFYWGNMWGGGALRAASNNAYAHELYLDLLSDAGIIAYILSIVFVFSRTVRAVRFAFSQESKISPLISSLIFGIFLSLNIEFFIEPILQGVPWLFPTFCVVCGMVDYLILKHPSPEKTRKDSKR